MCDICNVNFSDTDQLKIHQFTQHNYIFTPKTYGDVFPQTIVLRKKVSKTLTNNKRVHPLTLLGLPTFKPMKKEQTPQIKKQKQSRKRKQKNTHEQRESKKMKQDDENKMIFNPVQYVPTGKFKYFNAVGFSRKIRLPIFFDTSQKRNVFFPFGFGLCRPVPIVKGG